MESKNRIVPYHEDSVVEDDPFATPNVANLSRIEFQDHSFKQPENLEFYNNPKSYDEEDALQRFYKYGAAEDQIGNSYGANKRKWGSSYGKQFSGSTGEEARILDIKPRFDEVMLTKKMQEKMNEIYDEPVEYYEVKLYELCRRFNQELYGKDLTFSCLDHIHHIYQLKQQEDKLNDEELMQLNQNLETVLMEHPTAWAEYSMFRDCIELLSCLLVKWNVVALDDYAYRLTGRGVNVKMLDLLTMNTNFMTVETLWFTIISQTLPLKDFLDESIKQYSSILQTQTLKTIKFLLRMNQHCDFSQVPSIEGLIASRKKVLVDKKNMQPDFNAENIEYQRLRQPTGFLAKCFKTSTQQKAVALKDLLSGMELAYRSFERALIGNLLVILGKNKPGKPLKKHSTTNFD